VVVLADVVKDSVVESRRPVESLGWLLTFRARRFLVPERKAAHKPLVPAEAAKLVVAISNDVESANWHGT